MNSCRRESLNHDRGVERPRRIVLAAAAFALLCGGCSGFWSSGPRDETNIAFRLDTNRPALDVQIDGRPTTMILATALRRSVVDLDYESGRKSTKIFFGNLSMTRLEPNVADLGDIGANGLLGADAFAGHVLTIDYQRGLLSVTLPTKSTSEVPSWPFSSVPAVPVLINGKKYMAIVDTSLPDTAIVPRTALVNPAATRSGSISSSTESPCPGSMSPRETTNSHASATECSPVSSWRSITRERGSPSGPTLEPRNRREEYPGPPQRRSATDVGRAPSCTNCQAEPRSALLQTFHSDN